MMSLNLYLAVICFLNACALGFAADCNDQQIKRNGRCCELCPAGTHVKEWCSQGQSTVCTDCPEGQYSDESGVSGTCITCLTCQHEYVRKCTATTNAKCSCHHDFLCSNDVCSRCEKKSNCKKGEELKRTGLKYYSYVCEPCPDNTYSDTDKGDCKPLTQCSDNGLMTLFPGNKTHNAHCGIHGGQNAQEIQVILATGFIVFAVALLMFLSYACVKNIRKGVEKSRHAPNTEVVSLNNTCDFQHSKEESGYQLVCQDKPKDSISSISSSGLYSSLVDERLN